MSAEVYGMYPSHNSFVREAAHQAAKILVATGERPDMAYTIGERTAQYAVELALASLVECGAIDPNEMTRSERVADMVVLADCTIKPENVAFYEADFDAKHPEVAQESSNRPEKPDTKWPMKPYPKNVMGLMRRRNRNREVGEG